MDTLVGRTAVITGAASGIGLEMARRFAGAGARLMLADIEEPALEAAHAEFHDEGVEVESMVVDVSDLDQVRALERAAVECFGKVHLLCNNAGVGGGGMIATPDDIDYWRWVIDIDLWGVIYGCKAFLPAMIAHGEPAHVVNTASMAGLGSSPGLGAYSVAKYGVVALSETLSMEMQMQSTAVGVSVLCPQFVKTGIADSHRNLREGLERHAAAEGPLGDAISAAVAGGIDVEIVGAAVLDGVLNDTFWILTHEHSAAHVVARAESIAKGKTPRPPVLGPR